MSRFSFIVIISTCLSIFAISGATYEQQVVSECAHTRFPKLCADHLQTLSYVGSENPTISLVSSLIEKTISENNLPPSTFEAMSYHFISEEAQNTRNAIGECRELLNMSTKRLNQALEAVKQSPSKNKEDIQTWISAALTYQQTCKDIAESQSVSNAYMAEISKKMEYLSQLGSNPLALVNRIQGTNPRKGRTLLDSGFPSWVSAKDRKLLQSSTIHANAVVAKDGSGDYTTVSAAIAAAGGRGFVIYVKSGVYNEKVHCNKDGITLVGDGKYSTIISGSSSVGGGSSLLGSSTVTISGDKFIAKDIGFQNNAGVDAGQALAITMASDHSVLFRCSIAGYQDTLFALSLRQFYRECDIYGTVDFVFGNAAAVFQNCYFTLRKPRSGGHSVIMANGRTDPGQNTGFSLHNCKITGATSNNYLGRPWKTYSRAVVMQSNIDGVISSRGWEEWPGSSGYAKTLYFAEFQNMGSGAGTGGRVQWPGYHVIAREEATKYTVGTSSEGTHGCRPPASLSSPGWRDLMEPRCGAASVSHEQ